jgi:pumilio RNA-binding family
VLELGSIDMKRKIFACMSGKIAKLSADTYGCRVIQRALEEFKTEVEVQDQILQEAGANVLQLIEDQNGNHVIQKCFETIDPQKLQFIVDVVIDNILTLAFHAYGCRVIQRILEHTSQETTQPMMNKLMGKCIECAQSQYGNYIMQHLLEKGPKLEKDYLLSQLQPNFVRLSMNKFASNATEKSVLHGSMDYKRGVCEVLLNTYYDNKLGLLALMNHPYGNYVIQRLFENSDDHIRQAIYTKTQTELGDELKKNNHGKHVMGFIEKYMENNLQKTAQ